MELKQYQKEAVEELVKKTKKYLGNRTYKKIYLEAPTGAGKTVIASAALEEITRSLPYDYNSIVNKVAFVWLAPNKLHEQSYFSMKSYFKYTNDMHPIIWDELDHSLGYLEHGDILFLNWQSVNKSYNLIMNDNEQRKGLPEVIKATRLEQQTPIVVIIDEEHESAGPTATRAQEFLAKIHPDVEIRISATPDYPKDNNYEKIVIDRHDVVKEEMIKKDVMLNPDVDTQKAEDEGLGIEGYLLKLALLKREELKARYAKIGGMINPLLLIQLPNDNKKVSADDNKIVDIVKTYLALPQIDITEANGKLGVWLSEDKKNIDDIAKDDNLTEVMLFKEAISKGWDCPRAAILLIFRKTDNKSFTIQTVGRILRMPQQKYYSDDTLNHGYVFTNIENRYIEITKDEEDYMLTSVSSEIRKSVTSISLPAQYVGVHKVQNALGYMFRSTLRKCFEEMWDLNQPILNFQGFTDEDIIDPTNPVEKPEKKAEEGQKNNVLANRNKMAMRGIDLDIHKLYVTLPKDMTIEVEGTGVYEAKKTASIANTQGEVDRMFKNFCYSNLIQFDKRDSTSALSSALIEFMEKYVEFEEKDAKKIILFWKNRPKFVSVIKKAQERYAKDMAKRQKEAKQTITEAIWTLPAMREYKEETHHQENAYAHALQPYYELNGASNPEKRFREFLEQQNESVEWWYKNGDSGKQNFSVVYTNSQRKKAGFYVDFIIKLRNGRICLFDTKSSTGDAESVNKHNALVDYLNKYNEEKGTNMIGGIIIEDNGQWLYSPTYIDSAANHAGWSAFDPEELNQ